MHKAKLLLVVMALMAVACNTTEQTTSEKEVAKIGSQISLETANAMIGNVAGRQSQPVAFIYGKIMLQAMLNTPGAEGILLFNGMDKTGKTKLIFRPADATGSAVANSEYYQDGNPCPPACPTSDISSIGKVEDTANAKSWIATYRAANPNSARSFLFGRDIINTLLAQQGVAGIAFYKGAKSTGEAFVLVGVSEEGAMMWDGVIVDDSKQCPPECPPEEL
jgi:hypothetical protein